MKRSNIFDTSENLLVQRWRSGVRLMRPEWLNQPALEQSTHIEPPYISTLFKMPFNVYFLNTESVIQNMSETTAHICGFQAKNDAIGNTARAVSKKESAEFSINHNNEVISRNSIVIKDEHFLRLDDFEFRDIAIKFPLLNADEEIIGVFGCSIIIDFLAQSLDLLMKTGLLATSNILETQRNYYPMHLYSDIHQYNLDNLADLGKKLSDKSKQCISKREVECLYYLMKGKSARETGEQINLSQRTVEYYLNSLKDKLHCTKKSEIIDKVLGLLKRHDYFL